MCKSPLHGFLTATPKVENHLHIEGTLEPSLLFTLAAKNHISLPQDPSWASPAALKARYEQFTCLDDFLHYLYTGATVLVTASDFEDLAWAYFLKAASMNIRHVEVSFDPQMHTVRGVSYDDIISGLAAAKQRAMTELSPALSVEYIACIQRHLPLGDSHALIDTILDRGHLVNGTLCGAGLVSSEKSFPPEQFTGLFDRVAPSGTNLTAHVGEEGGPEAVRAALQYLNVHRIDHGVAAALDAELLADLARRRVLLTLCPWSNVALKVVPSLAEAPVRAFLGAGVRFSLNSDDPAFNGAYLQDVYCRVQETFGLTLSEWEWIIRGGIEGSWLPAARKDELLREFQQTVDLYKDGS